MAEYLGKGIDINSYTENYLRLHLLEVKGGTPVLRSLFLNIVSNSPAKGDADKYLRYFKRDIQRHKHGSDELKVLFPSNGCTNIDKWDVSLLAYVLIHCCTLEGQFSLKGKPNPRELLKKEIEKKGDLSSFLIDNKKELEKLLITSKITQQQYETLYSQDLPTVDFAAWDVELVLHVLFKVCSDTRLLQKVHGACMGVVNRHVNIFSSKIVLGDFLKEYQHIFDEFKKEQKLDDTQYKQIFPNTNASDATKWKNEVLICVVVNTCKYLSQLACNGVKTVRHMRKELGAHTAETNINNDDFLKKWTVLYGAIHNIATEIPETQSNVEEEIRDLLRGPLDIQNSVKYLQQWYANQDTKYDKILEILTAIESNLSTTTVITRQLEEIIEQQNKVKEEITKQQIKVKEEIIEQQKKEKEEIIEQHNKLKEDLMLKLDELLRRLPEQNLSAKRDSEEFAVAVDVSGDDINAVENANSSILRAANGFEDDDIQPVKMHTDEIKELLSQDGNEISEAKKGSIILVVKCLSLHGVHSMLRTLNSNELKDRLCQLQKVLSEINKCPIRLGIHLSDSSIMKITGMIEEFAPQSAAKEEETVKTLIKKTETEPVEQKIYSESDTVSKTEEIVEIAMSQAKIEPVGQKVYLDTVSKTEEIVEIAMSQAKIEPVGQKVYLDTVSKTEEIVEIAMSQAKIEPVGQKVYLDTVSKTEEIVEIAMSQAKIEPVGQKVYLDTGSPYESAVKHFKTMDQLQVYCREKDSNIIQESVDKTVDKAGMAFSRMKTPTYLRIEKCGTHAREAKEYYCSVHDVDGCSTCMALNHRNCRWLDYLPNVAKGIKTSTEFKDVTDGMKHVQVELFHILKSKEEDLKKIRKDKDKCLMDIDAGREMIVKHLDKMVKKAKEEVDTVHNRLESKVNTDVQTLLETKAALDNSIKHFDNLEGDNEVNLFLNVRKEKQNNRERTKLLEQLKQTPMNETINFSFNSNITDYFVQFKNIGEVKLTTLDNVYITPQPYPKTRNIKPIRFAALHRKISVSDDNWCNMQGSCQLDDGSLIITNRLNGTLTRLDTSYKVVDKCKVSASPWGVCRTSTTDVAVALYDDRKIQFVSTSGRLSVSKSFRVKEIPNYLAASKGELFVTSDTPPQVGVYNMTGSHLRTISNYPTGRRIFDNPRGIVLSNDGTKVHVIDKSKGVITMTRQGQVQHTFTDPQLDSPWGVCILENDNLLVYGQSSINIIQVDNQGRKINVLPTETDLKPGPQLLTYDVINSRLIAAMDNYITVFNLLR